jgi:NCS2 family nucleobase:cation symporter-2
MDGRPGPTSTRPEDLIYAVDELPPWPRLIFLGAQHAMLMSVYLVLIVMVFRSADASHAETLNALSLGMIALAISTVLQAIWRGPVGSGYLAPPVFSAIYIGPAVFAADTGGLPAVFAMTIFAGLVEIGLAPLLPRLRGLFPPAISGFIVAIVVLQLGSSTSAICSEWSISSGRPSTITSWPASLLSQRCAASACGAGALCA